MEIKYGKEPLDLRLTALRLLKNWWILPVCVLTGALLFGGIYYLVNIQFGPARTYVAESEYYVEYKDAITYEQQYTFYNEDTWRSLGHTDLFMKIIQGELLAEGFSLTDEELAGSFTTTLLTDVRIVHATVSTTDPALSMAISRALPDAFVAFGEQQREIDEIRLISSVDSATLKALDDRTMPAAILGAVIAFFVTIFVMYIYVILDDSVYTPMDLTRRFGIWAETFEEACNVSVYYDEETKTVHVKAGDRNSTALESLVYELRASGKEIEKFCLFNADHRLLKAYYKTGSKKESK